MAAFSGHREDGDELLEWRFRAAYSHVEERWWEKRGEDEFPLLSLWRRGSSNPPHATIAWRKPYRDVLSSCAGDVVSEPLKSDETKCLSSMSWGDRVKLCSYPHVPSLSPSTPLPDHWISLSWNPSHASGERMHLPPPPPLTSFSSFAF